MPVWPKHGRELAQQHEPHQCDERKDVVVAVYPDELGKARQVLGSVEVRVQHVEQPADV